MFQVRNFVAEQLALKGIEFHTEETPLAIIKSPDGSLSLKTNKETIEGFSHIMFATGRKPNTKVVFFLSFFSLDSFHFRVRYLVDGYMLV